MKMSVFTRRLDAEARDARNDVVSLARAIQREHPAWSWGQCIAAAERSRGW